jgi:predicted porin
MQKKLIAVAVAGLMSGAAFAQSNVTVYGVADAYWASVKTTNVDRYYAVQSGGLSGSRIGFKAVEDLGNGTSALAVIEYGFSIDSGNSAAGDGGYTTSQDATTGAFTTTKSGDNGLNARQKLVGLTGGWGTAVAGYAQTAGYDFACAATTFGGSALDPENTIGAGLLLSCGNNGRSPNALAYISPNFGGFTAAINHGRLTEGKAGTTGNAGKSDASATLLAGTYAGGPVTVNGVYAKITDNDTVLIAAKSVKEFGLRGAYDLGVAKLTASYQSKDTEGVDNKDTSYTFGVGVPVGAGTIVASLGQAKLKETAGTDRNKKDAFAVAYLHSLSKRTTAYAGLNHTNNKTGATDIKTDTIAIGLRHTF